MLRYFLIIFSIFFLSCTVSHKLSLRKRKTAAVNGADFYNRVAAIDRNERELQIIKEITAGNIPDFLRKLVPVNVYITDSASGKIIKVTYFVTADYLSIGNNKNFARVPMTPMAAQQIADSLHCFLPTKKMVDDIYAAAKIKLAPQPLTVYRDSAITFYQHHLLIEEGRKNRHGLIAGIKKDVVISSKINSDAKPNRVAIYGWHQLNGQPIQPLYTGHVNWYVDYSHGIRLVYRTVLINGKAVDYIDVLKDKLLRKLLSDEQAPDCYRYNN